MRLLTLLKKNDNSRKIFGKREIKIIEKQLLGVNLTQSEKNRLSRDIRKKFEFIAEVSNYKEQFDLKKGAEIKRIIKETKEIILEDKLFSKIRKIIVYGSFVRNNLSLNSDIDIAVKFNKITLKESTLFRKRVLGKVNKRIDLQVYNYLPNKVLKEINEEGKIIYEK